MKLVLAIISPNQLSRVAQALADHHVHGLTVTEAQGFGQEHDRDHPEHREYAGLELIRKCRLEIACHDEEVEAVLEAIYKSTHTGLRGDGKIFVLPVLDSLRLKTGERGEAALGPRRKSGPR
ncbi:MAG: glnK [Pedosphaera sp.]|nr:glnK [Pedosphaera sp.]